MKRLLRKWLSAGLVVSFLTISICFSEDNSPSSVATDLYNLFREKGGTEKALKQQFLNPLLGGGRLWTLDETKEGEVQLVCPSSKEFLTVLIKPKSTGDFDADIYWDSDMDGRMDRSMTVSNVSGICTNGFISCDPGTWVNCRNYTFEYNNGNLQLQEVGLTSLAGCFCINQSCGSNLLWNNIGYILKIFGGAVAGAFQKADSRYAISDARVDGAAIYFYGQRTRECGVAEGGSGALYPESYWKTPLSISGAIESLVFSQSQDPNSYYNMLKYAASNQESYECLIRNIATPEYQECLYPNPIVTKNTEPYCQGYTVGTCGENCVQIKFGFKDTPHTSQYGVKFSHLELIKSVILSVGGLDDDGGKQFYFNGNLVYQTGGGNSCFWGYSGNVTSLVQQDNIINIVGLSRGCGSWDSHDRCGYVTLTILYDSRCPGDPNIRCDGNIPPRCCVPRISIVDGCENFQNRSDCSLKDEIKDNVYVIKDQIRTGLVPIRQCQQVCENMICPDFWIDKKVFICSNDSYDLSSAKRRLGTISSTLSYSESSGQLQFTDTRMIGSSWVDIPNQQFFITAQQKPDGCEKACRVKVLQTNTQVALGSPISQQHITLTNDFVYYYRPCYNNTCPVEEGEVIDIPCQCMNDFGAASTLMQTTRLAGQDMICTSGNIKTLPGY